MYINSFQLREVSMRQKTILGLIIVIMVIGVCSAAEDKFFGKYYAIHPNYNITDNYLLNNGIQQLEEQNIDNQKFLLIPTSDVLKEGALAQSYYIVSTYNSQVISLSVARSENSDDDETPTKSLIEDIFYLFHPRLYILNKIYEKHNQNSEDLSQVTNNDNSQSKDQEGNNILIYLSTFQGNSNQQWKIEKLEGADEGYYAIYAPHPYNKKVIEVYEPPGDSNQNYLRIGDWINTDKQKWMIEPVEVAPTLPLAQPEIGRGEINRDLPKLTGWDEDIPYETTPRIVSEKYLPCIYVNDPYSDQDKAKIYPWYRLRFSQMWRQVYKKPFERDGISSIIATEQMSYVVGVSENDLEAFDEIVDKTASSDLRLKINEYLEAAIGGSIETQEDRLQSQMNERASLTEYSAATSVKYPPGIRKIAYIYQMIDRYTILDNDGGPVGEPIDIKTPIVREVAFTDNKLKS
jgi:hypothetical protein